jgi:hypothetical protein
MELAGRGAGRRSANAFHVLSAEGPKTVDILGVNNHVRKKDAEGHENAAGNAELVQEPPGSVTFVVEIAGIKCRERKIGKEGLEGDVNVTRKCPKDIHWVFTAVNHEILDELEKLH